MEPYPMKPADLDAPIRAIDILRIALDLPTAAERKARIERAIASVTMQAHEFGVTVTFADGRRVSIAFAEFCGSKIRRLARTAPLFGARPAQPSATAP